MSLGSPNVRGAPRLAGGRGQPTEGSARDLSLCWIGLAALSAIAVLLVFWAYVPLNMDEFVSYQTLAALYHPHSDENVFCSSNASFYLRVLGRFNLPLLTYDYIGSLSSLLYAPFFLVWPSPMSARITGVLALFVQALVLAKMFRFRTGVAFCCLLFFLPYSFAHIADTGPVAFQTTSVFIVCYLLHRWILSRRRSQRAWMMAAAGLMIALGCWVKPTYFFVSAGLAITAVAGFFLALVRRPGERLRRTAEYLILVACAAVPAALVYQAQRPGGGAYLPVLTEPYVPSQIFLTGLGERFRENVFHFLVNPLDSASHYFDVLPQLPLWRFLTCLLAGLLILGGVLARGIGPRHRREILLNYALFALALLLVATNLYAKSMHHAVLAYPFLILAVARGVQRRRRGFFLRATLAAFIILNGSLFFRFPSLLAASRRISESKVYVAQLNDELSRNQATDSVIACVDWGIYFVQALYGPRSQVVLFLCAPDDEKQLESAAAIARRLHRNLAVVGLDGNQRVRSHLRAEFPGTSERAASGSGNPWRIWEVPYRRLEALGSAGSAPAVARLR